MINKIIDTIASYDKIALFRHEYPDMDAIGSQLGLKAILQAQYPNKDVRALGGMSEAASYFVDEMDHVSDDWLDGALAIILDTSNAARVDDQRYTLATTSIRIDHHVPIEHFCELEYIDEKATATCELLALGLNALDIRIPKMAAQMLYSGLIADSIRFTIGTVRPETMQAAGYLIGQGVDVIQCEEDNFATNYPNYVYETKVREKAMRKGDALVAIMEPEDYAPMTFSQAKEKVYVLAGIREISCWGLFTRMEDGIHYAASLRSKRKDVRQIAMAYHGGGHICAAGIKNLEREQVDAIIDQLKKLSLE
ncbi:MAG: bifunctional oligoribonuclease/PAP phosphatase NrnA [Absicoccus sp.]|uniref:DHH family phosphoesterase n=1 Tax=Absicoccus sp. TaxID=2718527 RepID=UPI002A7541F5|nr:bifunctional oligoribonuclease/PAP phosphatase NrnA [Absicoccus sp.]MDY3034708.1 bifunctional oligoribonuclease/PAP phosphatase NrnA [Absicoccus sp.]